MILTLFFILSSVNDFFQIPDKNNWARCNLLNVGTRTAINSMGMCVAKTGPECQTEKVRIAKFCNGIRWLLINAAL
jgi:hypothetical protein